VLFTVLSTSGAERDAAVAAVSTRTGERRVLVKGASSARYAPTGHLLYVRGEDLMAVPFDGDRLTTSGSPVVAVSKLQVISQLLKARFDLSAEGTLIYVLGDSSLERTLVWSDRNGTLRPAPMPPRPFTSVLLRTDRDDPRDRRNAAQPVAVRLEQRRDDDLTPEGRIIGPC
jgi:hypothetical protein